MLTSTVMSAHADQIAPTPNDTTIAISGNDNNDDYFKNNGILKIVSDDMLENSDKLYNYGTPPLPAIRIPHSASADTRRTGTAPSSAASFPGRPVRALPLPWPMILFSLVTARNMPDWRDQVQMVSDIKLHRRRDL